MTESVIDVLELVDVRQRHGQGATVARGPLELTVEYDPVLDATGTWHGEYISRSPGPHDGFFEVPTEITLQLFETDGVISGTWAQENVTGSYAGSLSGTRTGGHLELVLEDGEYDRLLSADFAGPHLIEASLDHGSWVDSMHLWRQ